MMKVIWASGAFDKRCPSQKRVIKSSDELHKVQIFEILASTAAFAKWEVTHLQFVSNASIRFHLNKRAPTVLTQFQWQYYSRQINGRV